MPATAPHEIEVKLRLEGIDALARAGMNLEVETARHFEENWLLDTPDQYLGSREAVLRVRNAGGVGTVTLKEKAAADAPASQFKKRLEIESGIQNPQQAIAIFERLGFRSWFHYQKYRTVYRITLPEGQSLHAMFDETPLGNFIELEGEEDAIAAAVRRLGIEPGAYILESYLALQLEFCRQQGIPLKDMVFES
jgi:adenylate cyclase class 2